MKLQLGLLSTVLLLSSCAGKTGVEKDIVSENFDFAADQLKYAFVEIDSAKMHLTDKQKENGAFSPRNIEPDGSLRLVASRDWCSGFFPGELWYMYERTGDDFWKEKAVEFTAPVEKEKTNGGTHDMGFKVYCSFGNGYRLTGDSIYRDIMLEAARTLTTRYKDKVGCIRSWDHNKDKWQCPVIIDNMMNLELLFWAAKESGDSTFRDIAENHALTTMKNHFRDDNSSYHVVDYDTITGEVLHKHTHQGYAHESAWSRGQAWGLYGYTMCYRETGREEFLDQAKKISDYIFNSPTLPEDLIPYWDYNAPDIPNEPRDVSAAAVTACALYELSMYDKENAERHVANADNIIESLTNNYRAKLNGDRGFLMLHSVGSGNHNSEIDVPIIYADYYFLEALLKKDKLAKEGTAIL